MATPAPVSSTPSNTEALTLDQVCLALQQLKTENMYLREKQRAIEAHFSGSIVHQKEPRISLPDKFDGTRSEFRGFINQVKLIIQLHPQRYPNGIAQVGLIGTLLSKAALAWFAPLVETDSPLLADFKAFLKEFEATFGDSERARTAATKLRNLRQGSRAASAYAAEFRQIACDVSWGEAALADQFRSGLASDVKDLLLTLPDATTLADAITQAVRCDNRLFERRKEKRLDNPSPGLQQLPSPDPSRIQTPTAASTPPAMNTPLVGDPMQIGGTRYKRLTPEERLRRLSNNLCLYCGGAGHYSRSCPNRRTPSLAVRGVIPPHVTSEMPNPLISAAGNGNTQP
jgi:retrotransposon gag protein